MRASLLIGVCSCRLLVTDDGRNSSAAHLELSFEHDYQARETSVVDQSPPLKKQKNEATWKRNVRGPRHLAEPAPVVVESCVRKCSGQCKDVLLQHRLELRDCFQTIWAKEGEHGARAYLERLIDVVEPNMATMAKHGMCHSCSVF